MSETTVDLGLEFAFGPERPEQVADGVIRTELETIMVDESHVFDASENTNPVTKLFKYLASESKGDPDMHGRHYFAGTQPDQVAIITQSSGDAVLYVKPDVQTRYPKPSVAYHLRRDAAGTYTLAASMPAKGLEEVHLRPDQPIVYGHVAKDTNQATIVVKEGGMLHDYYKSMREAADAGRKSRLGRFFTGR